MRVRMFAALREAAGTGEIRVEAATLAELLDLLRARYGPTFAARLALASVLVDGNPVARDAEVDLAGAEEVALLPPVSGGAGRPEPRGPRAIDQQRRDTRRRVGSLAIVAVLAATMFLGQIAFTLAVIGLAALVLVDLSAVFARVDARPVGPAAAAAALGGPLLAALEVDTVWQRLPTLLASAMLLAFVLVVVFGRRHGAVRGLGGTAAVGVLAGLGGAALLLLRAHLPGVGLLGGYLALAATADWLVLPPAIPGRVTSNPLRRSGPLLVGVVFVAAALLLWLDVLTPAIATSLAAVVIVSAIVGHRLLWGLVTAATAGGPTAAAPTGAPPTAAAPTAVGPGWAAASAITVLLGAPLAYAVVRAIA